MKKIFDFFILFFGLTPEYVFNPPFIDGHLRGAEALTMELNLQNGRPR